LNKIIIRRCAWHKKYFGEKKILSTKYVGHPEGSDNKDEDIDAFNTEIMVTDGCCSECAEKVRNGE